MKGFYLASFLTLNINGRPHLWTAPKRRGVNKKMVPFVTIRFNQQFVKHVWMSNKYLYLRFSCLWLWQWLCVWRWCRGWAGCGLACPSCRPAAAPSQGRERGRRRQPSRRHPAEVESIRPAAAAAPAPPLPRRRCWGPQSHCCHSYSSTTPHSPATATAPLLTGNLSPSIYGKLEGLKQVIMSFMIILRL